MKVLQAGCSVDDFYNNTFSENTLLLRADRRNQYREDARLRLAVYTLSLPHIKDSDRKDIYDWMPLDFDPSEAERKEAKKKQDKVEEQHYLKLIKKVTGG